MREEESQRRRNSSVDRSLIWVLVAALLPILTACGDGTAPVVEPTEFELCSKPNWIAVRNSSVLRSGLAYHSNMLQRGRTASLATPANPFTIELTQTDALGRTAIARQEISVVAAAAPCP